MKGLSDITSLRPSGGIQPHNPQGLTWKYGPDPVTSPWVLGNSIQDQKLHHMRIGSVLQSNMATYCIVCHLWSSTGDSQYVGGALGLFCPHRRPCIQTSSNIQPLLCHSWQECVAKRVSHWIIYMWCLQVSKGTMGIDHTGRYRDDQMGSS